MKGKRFIPVPDPDGVLIPPPRKPPIALATAAPVPPRRDRDLGGRVALPRRLRRRGARGARIGTALDRVAQSIAAALRRHART